MKPRFSTTTAAMILSSRLLCADDADQNSAIGPHWQRLESVSSVQNAGGELVTVTNSFTQVETGLNYLTDQGTWVAAKAEIAIVEGEAVAFQGQHKVSFAGNLNTSDAIRHWLPDGRLLASHVYGLAYYDSSSGQSALIASTTNCVGWLYGSNQAIYTNAFDTVSADVRYTYTKSGFEQDIILRSSPPSPSEYGLNPATSRLEVWTEFLSPPEPARDQSVITQTNGDGGQDSLVDECLHFGSMRIGTGKAFVIGEEDESLALVAKQWVSSGDRRFLVEAVELNSVADQLQSLPPAENGGASLRKASRNRMEAMRALPMVPSRKGRSEQAAFRKMSPSQKLELDQRVGLVVDYSILNSTQTNYLFRSDTTYLISGNVVCSGTNTTFEGGTVLKFSSTNTPKITVNTPLTWQGDIYRPVIATATDDSSVGSPIGTNTLSGYYADTALDLEAGTANTTFTLAHLRVSYAKKAIVLNQKSAHTLSHVQLVGCQNGILPTSTDFNLRNALFYNVLTNFNGSSATCRVEHLTVDTASWFNYNSTFGSGNLKVTNSLLVAVTNAGSYTASSVSTSSSPSTVFQTVGGGSHYLAPSSAYVNAGSASINATLAKDFRNMTTFPPIIRTNAVVVSTVLSPQAERDITAPDLGYHYPVLDYLTTSLQVSGATLSVTNGATVGFSAAYCFLLETNAVMVVRGLPNNLSAIARYALVQENRITGADTSGNYQTFNTYAPNAVSTNAPVIDCRFAGSYLNGSLGGNHFYIDDGNFNAQSIVLRDSQMYGGNVQAVTATRAVSIRFSNNFWWRTFFDIEGPSTLEIYNQLLRFGYCYFEPAYTNTWIIKDNAFDQLTVDSGGPTMLHGYNAYIGGGTALSPANHDITLSTFTYASTSTGLGPWYQGQTNLINQGSRTADLAGLYHYTTQTSQTKETNSVVDIGFHYVSVDGTGYPIDTDGDGYPDYVEDADGDGSVDSGETAWQSAGDLGLKVWITEPKANSNIP